MRIEPETTAGKAEDKGKTHYFCTPGCKAPYEIDSEMYL
jgi:YHS domain-containing protein